MSFDSSSPSQNRTSSNNASLSSKNGATYFDFVKPTTPENSSNSSSNLKPNTTDNRQRTKSVSYQLLKDYKDLEDKSLEIFNSINLDLSNLVKLYDLNDEDSYKNDINSNKETLVLKILEIQRNEKLIRLQFEKLIFNNFKSFYKNLTIFNSLIFTNFNNLTQKKESPDTFPLENDVKLKKKKNQKMNIIERIENIQKFAELVDQRLRILELAKKLIIENR